MTTTQHLDRTTLTELMRAAWAEIYCGRADLASAVEVEAAASDEQMGDDSVPGPRVRAAWDLMTLAENRVQRGEAEEEQVRLLAVAADVDLEDILETLVGEVDGSCEH